MPDGFFGTIVTTPLYNGLVGLMQIFPWADLGIAVILFTILIRLILFPLAQASLRTQMVAQNVQPEIDALREKYKSDSQQQAMKIMEVYRRERINPFASIFFLGIQIPIIFGLYFMFLKSGLPVINPDLLYPFISGTGHASTMFLGIVDVTLKSIPVAILAGLTQFIQARLMKMPEAKPKQGSFGGDFMKGMQFQMKYIFPLIIIFISASLPASIAIYWTTSNLFSIAQEYVIRKRLERGAVKV